MTKIHFSNVDFSSQSGPNTFGYRLAKELMKRNHEIVNESTDHDIYLTFIESFKTPPKNVKSILRLDGIWIWQDSHKFNVHNKHIKHCYDTYDHVVFQSNFDKAMVEHHWGQRENTHVIHNGAQPEEIVVEGNQRDPAHLRFVCAASWHRQKRLLENVRLFQHVRKQLQEEDRNATLYILGKNAEGELTNLSMEERENVEILGQKPHEFCLALYSVCDYMIHLAWLDHCPNVVVESLIQGCPVICTDSGGTKEIVVNNGIIIPETTQYEFELVDYDSPYGLDYDEFILPKERPVVSADHLRICHVADKYEKVFNG